MVLMVPELKLSLRATVSTVKNFSTVKILLSIFASHFSLRQNLVPAMLKGLGRL